MHYSFVCRMPGLRLQFGDEMVHFIYNRGDWGYGEPPHVTGSHGEIVYQTRKSDTVHYPSCCSDLVGKCNSIFFVSLIDSNIVLFRKFSVLWIPSVKIRRIEALSSRTSCFAKSITILPLFWTPRTQISKESFGVRPSCLLFTKWYWRRRPSSRWKLSRKF